MEATDRLTLIMNMLKKDPEDSFLNYALAMEYLAKDETENAIRQLEELVDRDANYLGTYYQLGKLYEQKEEADKAILIYKRGIEVAKQQDNNKAHGELNEALWLLEDE
ncbi:MAG: tetratricopeptide repeat protein [Bacteroidia bacterium]